MNPSVAINEMRIRFRTKLAARAFLDPLFVSFSGENPHVILIRLILRVASMQQSPRYHDANYQKLANVLRMAELEVANEKTRGEIAAYFRDFADKLDTAGDPMRDDGDTRTVTIIAGNESATVTPPDSMQFLVEVETESSLLNAGTDRGITFSLGWNEDQVDAPERMDIE